MGNLRIATTDLSYRDEIYQIMLLGGAAYPHHYTHNTVKYAISALREEGLDIIGQYDDEGFFFYTMEIDEISEDELEDLQDAACFGELAEQNGDICNG